MADKISGPGYLSWTAKVWVRVISDRLMHLRAVGVADDNRSYSPEVGYVVFRNKHLTRHRFITSPLHAAIEENKNNLEPLRDDIQVRHSALRQLLRFGINLAADETRLRYASRCIRGGKKSCWEYLYRVDITETERDNLNFAEQTQDGERVAFIRTDEFYTLLRQGVFDDQYRFKLTTRFSRAA